MILGHFRVRAIPVGDTHEYEAEMRNGFLLLKNRRFKSAQEAEDQLGKWEYEARKLAMGL